MKFRLIIQFCILLTILPIFITSCASTGFLMAKPKVILLGKTYPPKDEQETIDVYFTKKPDKNYVEFARITCADTSDKWCLQQISKKAKTLGADGIIIIGKADSYGMGVPIGNLTYMSYDDYGMEAIAIKYK
ncbi:hypothetical protein [Flammeovirga sp. OC4]|uniref:hypothetical protein n=1 Tax=Flammeovirga sp. OC4 TaxID=1382345 RepID=UPI0006946E73|nr:hypothetical protein [Flammeovirga sp. OC4]